MRHAKKSGGGLLIASALAGLGRALSYADSPGIHPSSLRHTTTCGAQVQNAIKQFSQAAFDSKQFSSIADVTTRSDKQTAYFADVNGGFPTYDLSGNFTVLTCHGIGTLKNGTTHPLQWEVQFQRNHTKSDLGVEEVHS